MSCHNCGEKNSLRHKPTVMVKDVDNEKTVTEFSRDSFFGVKVAASSEQFDPPILSSDEVDGETVVLSDPKITRSKTQPVDTTPTPAVPSMQEVFEQAKSYSIDELMRRAVEFQKATAIELERAFSEMTPDMKIFHILSLLSTANYDNLSAPGISPDQAVVGLKIALDREDFNDINRLYPLLKVRVAHRYGELMSRKILLS